VAQVEVPLPYSQELEQSALINVDRVVDAVKEIV
jgi:pyruvate/2-oxoglutarate/acetoin dehydrogenase E1 component